jgi:transmembrane protein 216
MLSSLPLQILFFFNGWYDVAFTIAMSSLYAWKGSTLPYPDELRPMLGLEVAIVFLLAIIEYARIFLGTKGNKTEQSGPLLMSLVLGVPAMIANVYFLRLQIYVTRADLVLNAISIAFVGLEILLSMLTIITFAKAPPPQGDN